MYTKSNKVITGGKSMKRKILQLTTVAIFLVTLVGCRKDDGYDQAMRKMKEAIIEEKMEQADGFAELAIEIRPKEEEPKIYQQQVKLYMEAMEKKAADKKEEAMKSLDEVIAMTDGSEKLISYAKKEKEWLSTGKTETMSTEDFSKVDVEKTLDEEDDKNLWNSQTNAALQTYMAEFSNRMSQDYKQYTESHSVELYGLMLPETVLNGEWTMVVDDQPTQIEWSETGEGEAPYQLVAVYSDADTQPYLEKHVYFFVLHNGIPKVLVTEQNQGNEHKYLYFKETENPDLKSTFSGMVTK